MNAVPSSVHIVVADLERSTEWYARTLRCPVVDRGSRWALLRFPNGTVVELTAGDPAHPGLADASHRAESAVPVIPGYAVEDPQAVAAGLQIVRRFPDWIVVAAPAGLHVILHHHDVDFGRGLLGFRYTSPDAPTQQALLSALGSADPVIAGPTPSVVPIISSDRCERVTDPDGNPLELITRRS